MEPKLQRWVQRRGWDRACAHYEAYWAAQLRPAQELLLAQADLQPGEAVVDVACGTGLVTLPAAAAVGPSGRVLGLDISERMVDEGTRLAAERGRSSNVRFARCGAEHLTAAWPDGGDGGSGELLFDAALCSLGLMYMPDPVAALAEMARVVRPGGRVVVSVWGERRNCGWAEVFPIVDARVSSDVCPLFFALGGPGALDGAMELAGLTGTETTRLDSVLTYADSDEAVGAAFLGGPVALAHSRFDDDTRRSAHDEYLRSLEPFRHGRGYLVPGEFVVATARRGNEVPNQEEHPRWQ